MDLTSLLEAYLAQLPDWSAPVRPASAVGPNVTDLGDITTIEEMESWEGFVEGDIVKAEYYSFSLSEARQVSLELMAQWANADLQLDNARGEAITQSNAPGRENDYISTVLQPGTYQLTVLARERAPNLYRLAVTVSSSLPRAEFPFLGDGENQARAFPLGSSRCVTDYQERLDNATAIAVGETLSGMDDPALRFRENSRAHWYRITGFERRKFYHIELVAPPDTGATKARILLRDRTGCPTMVPQWIPQATPGRSLIYFRPGNTQAEMTNRQLYFTVDGKPAGTRYSITVKDVTADVRELIDAEGPFSTSTDEPPDWDFLDFLFTDGRLALDDDATAGLSRYDYSDTFGVWLPKAISHTFEVSFDPDGDLLPDFWLFSVNNNGLGLFSAERGEQVEPGKLSATILPGYFGHARKGLNLLWVRGIGPVKFASGEYRVTVTAGDEFSIPEPHNLDYRSDVRTGGHIAKGDNFEGRIHSLGDTDAFSAFLEEGQTYLIESWGAERYDRGGWVRDTHLALVNEDSSLITDTSVIAQLNTSDQSSGITDDNSGEGRNALLEVEVKEDGTYLIVAGEGASQPGYVNRDYLLSLLVDDFPASVNTNGRVNVGSSTTGNIQAHGDVDWFKVDLEQNQAYRVTLAGSDMGGGTLTDPMIVGIYDSDGNLLPGTSNNDISPSGRSSRAFLNLGSNLPAGTYFIAAGTKIPAGFPEPRSTEPRSKGTYTLSVRAYNDDFVPPGVAGDGDLNMGIISFGSSSTGRIEVAGDRDWFSVNLQPTERYRIHVMGNNQPDYGGALPDPYFELLDPNGDQLSPPMSDDNSGTGKNATISAYTPEQGGDYIIAVKSADHSDTGTYAVRVPVLPTELEFSNATPTVRENGRARVRVSLTERPFAPVTVTLTSLDTSVASVSPGTVTLTEDNWEEGVAFYVRGQNDYDAADEDVAITATAASDDAPFDGESATLMATVTDDDVVGFKLSTDSLSVREGTSRSFRVSLNTVPAGEIWVSVRSDDFDVAGISRWTLRFTPETWWREQELFVRGEQDDDAKNATATITLNPRSSDDPEYDGLENSHVAVSVIDDERPGMRFSSDRVEVGEQDLETLTIALRAVPEAPVTVTLTSDDEEVATVEPTTLTFQPASWNTGQTITITGKNDEDTDSENLTVTATAASDDPLFNEVKETLPVTVIDNDAPGIVTSMDKVTIDEGGDGTFTLRLQSTPAASVTLTLMSSDTDAATVSPDSIDFTTGNWNMAVTVTVTGVHDFDSATEMLKITVDSSSTDLDYNELRRDIDIEVTDDDPAGIDAPDTITVPEGGRRDLSVRLDTMPIEPVIITASTDKPGIATASQTLTFNPGNYDTAQTMRVRGIHDPNASVDMADITLTSRSVDQSYNGVTKKVTVTVTDDDTRGIEASDLLVNLGEPTTGSPTSYDVDVTLATLPKGDVTVSASSADTGAATVSSDTLTFNTNNWNVAQTVTITAIHDADSDHETVTVTLTSSSTADTDYNALTTDITVEVTDDDVPGLALSKTAVMMYEPPSDPTTQPSTDTFTVALASLPGADVTVSITSSNPRAATVSSESLTFTDMNYGTAVTVTVTGVGDFDEDDETEKITLETTSTDSVYEALTAEVEVTVNDTGVNDLCTATVDTPCVLEPNKPRPTEPEYLGDSAIGIITESEEKDWYRAEMNAGQDYQIILRGDSTLDPGGEPGTAQGDLLDDPYLTIYDSTGMLLSPSVVDDNSGDHNNAEITSFSPVSSGTYFIEVKDTGTATGIYTVEISTTLDCPSTKDTHCPVDVGDAGYASAAISGTANGNKDGSDRDWFALDLFPDTDYIIYVQGTGRSERRLQNPQIRGLFDNEGTKIDGTADTDGGYNYESALEFTSPDTGFPDNTTRYYLSVGSERENNGEYTVWVTEVDTSETVSEPAGEDLPRNYGTTGMLLPGYTATGEIAHLGDIDVWALHIIPGRIYEFEVKGSCDVDNGGSLADPAAGWPVLDDAGSCSNVRETFMEGLGTIPSADGRSTPQYRDVYYRTVSSQECSPYRVITFNTGGLSVEKFREEGGFYAYQSQLDCANPTDTGTYTVSLTDVTGEYSLSEAGVECCRNIRGLVRLNERWDERFAPSQDWPGDKTTSASLNTDSSLYAGISSEGDKDWYLLDFSQLYLTEQLLNGWEVSVYGDADLWDGGSLEDPYLTLYDTDGNKLAEDDNSGDGNNPVLRLSTSQIFTDSNLVEDLTGKYWLEVRAADDTSTGTYQIRAARMGGVSFRPGNDGVPGDSFVVNHAVAGLYTPPLPPDVPASSATPGRVALDDSVLGFWHTATDDDSYRLELTADTDYIIDVRGESPSDDGGSMADPYVVLYNSMGSEIDNDNDSGEDKNARIEYTPTASGTYFITVATNPDSDDDEEDLGDEDDRVSAIENRIIKGTYRVELTEDTEEDGDGDMMRRASVDGRLACTQDGDSDLKATFAAASYSVKEGESVTVTVTLSSAATETIQIPIAVVRRGGALPKDYTITPQNLLFKANDSSKTITVAAVNDTESDDGESIWLILCALPDGVAAGDNRRTQVSITDDDTPVLLEVGYAVHRLSVSEGASKTVDVQLSAAPEKEVSIPITVTEKGGSTSGDYTVSPLTLVFGAEETSKEVTISAADDALDDDGEGLSLAFGDLPEGISARNNVYYSTLTVDLVDTDVPDITASFDQATYSLYEGGSLEVGVELSEVPEREVVLPITPTGQDGADSGDYSVPANVTFAANEKNRTFTVEATLDDETESGESVLLSFGTLPDQVTAGTTATATVSISDDDFSDDTTRMGTLTIGSPLTGKIDAPGDRDWFKVDLTKDQAYLIDVKGQSSTDSGGTLTDPAFNIKFLLGSVVANLSPWISDDNSGADKNAREIFWPWQSGTFIIEVMGATDTETGTYTVSVRTTTDDYAEHPSTRGSIDVGGSAAGNINMAGDKDWFITRLQSNFYYTVTAEGADTTGSEDTLGNPALRLRGPEGEFLAEADGGGQGRNAKLFTSSGSSGWHFVEIYSPGNTGTGTYTVKLRKSDDYGASIETTGRLTFGVQKTGNISHEDDWDWFRVNLDAGKAYLVTVKGDVTGDNGGTLPDPALRLLDMSGNEVAKDEDSGQGNNARLYFVPSDTDRYFVSVQTNDGRGSGTYTVKVEQVTDDYGQSISTLGTVAVGSSIDAEIDFEGDRDWFRVSLVADQWYQIEVNSSGTPALDDPFVKLYGASGHPLSISVDGSEESTALQYENDDSGEGNNAVVYIRPAVAGVHYVEARSAKDLDTGKYTVVLTSISDDVGDDTTTTTSIDIPAKGDPSTRLTGGIEFYGDLDWYKMELEGEKWYRVTVAPNRADTSRRALSSPRLEVYDSQGDSLRPPAFAISLAGQEEASLTFKVPVAGDYFAEVSSDFYFQIGNYAIVAQTLDDHSEGPFSASTIDVDTSLTGVIEIKRDLDWFGAALETEKWYRIEARGDSLNEGGGTLPDPSVKLYNGIGNPIGGVEDDNSGDGNNASITFKLDTTDPNFVLGGSYFIEVKQPDGEGKGTYTLYLVEVVDDYTADIITTGEVDPESSIQARVDLEEDKDWFKVTLEADTDYEIEALGDNEAEWGGTLADPYLTLYDDSGNALSPAVEDDNGGNALNARLVVSPTDETTYYVEVKSQDSTGIGSYTLAVSALSSDDYSGDTSTTGTVAVDGESTGELERNGDTDWFEVDLEADKWYRFDVLGGTPTANGGTLENPYVTLYDSAGDSLSPTVEDDNSGVGSNARAYYRPSAAGTFYLEVSASGGAGTGTYTVSANAVNLATTVTGVAAGAEHTCVITSDDTTRCWGNDGDGRTTPPSTVFTSISAGQEHNCALDEDGTAHCWGKSEHGRTTAPTTEFKSVSSGGEHSCGIKKNDDTVECWGRDNRGQSTPPTDSSNDPIAFKQLSAGQEDTCGITSENGAQCWGRNKLDRHDPAQGSFLAISDGYDHGCAIRNDGSSSSSDHYKAACWGRDYNDELVAPSSVTFKAIQAGGTNACGITRSGNNIQCFSSDDTEPVYGPPGGTYTDLSYYYNHACAISSEGKVTCWGDNDDGKATPPPELAYVNLVRFHGDAQTIDEGGTATITVQLLAAASQALSVPIIATGRNGADAADYTVPGTVEFSMGETSKTIDVAAATDGDNDPGESVLLSFGTLPDGMGEASPATIEIAITDTTAPSRHSEEVEEPKEVKAVIEGTIGKRDEQKQAVVDEKDEEAETQDQTQQETEDETHGVKIEGNTTTTDQNGQTPAGEITAWVKPRVEQYRAAKADIKVDWNYDKCVGENAFFMVTLAKGDGYFIGWVEGDPSLYRKEGRLTVYDAIPGQSDYTTGWDLTNRGYEQIRDSSLDLSVNISCRIPEPGKGDRFVGSANLEDYGTPISE